MKRPRLSPATAVAVVCTGAMWGFSMAYLLAPEPIEAVRRAAVLCACIAAPILLGMDICEQGHVRALKQYCRLLQRELRKHQPDLPPAPVQLGGVR